MAALDAEAEEDCPDGELTELDTDEMPTPLRDEFRDWKRKRVLKRRRRQADYQWWLEERVTEQKEEKRMGARLQKMKDEVPTASTTDHSKLPRFRTHRPNPFKLQRDTALVAAVTPSPQKRSGLELDSLRRRISKLAKVWSQRHPSRSGGSGGVS